MSTDFSANLKPHPQADGAAILATERRQSIFDTEALSQHLFGTKYLERQTRLVDIISAEKIFSKKNQANLSRPDRYKLGLARGKRLRQLMDIHKWDDDDFLMAEWLVDDVLPHHLNTSLFKSALLEQCSEEQLKYWYPKMEAWEIVGSYAQTELSHGSNVRGLELMATWDQKTKEFVMHSPTLTASKWWNGTLGRTATHAVVVAQLRIPKGTDGKTFDSYGPHPFLIQIRDMKTHKPPPSIVVGDIGPKYGYASMDNAYMLMNQHRIPHSALLSRYAKVDPDTGEYSKPKNTGAMYGQLTRGRSQIVMAARLVLARAVTVAVRYLSIRRQFRDQDAGAHAQEQQVLNYSTVQIRVLPLLAGTFALHYSGVAMQQLYERTRGVDAQLESDVAQLSELHSTSAGLKSLATEMAADGIETCRRAMGGHGFGGGTGLIQLNADYLSKPTVEGDNWMITQQVARYLLKKVKELSSCGVGKGTSTLEASLMKFRSQARSPPRYTDLSDNRTILAAFEWRVASLAFEAYEEREVKKVAWNDLLIELRSLSRAHTQAMLVTNFYDGLCGVDEAVPSSSKAVLWDLFRLYSLSTIEKDAWQFQRSGAIATSALDQLPKEILATMQRIRPHAVRLVDSFALPDFVLNSDLGRFDGRVYESLFHRAHVENPLNRITFNPRYKEDEIVMGSNDGGEILAKL